MRTHLAIALRGAAIVGLVALNTRQIAHGRYLSAFVVGMAISAVWWHNSRTAAHHDTRYGWIAYALGAGVGTVCGMWVGR